MEGWAKLVRWTLSPGKAGSNTSPVFSQPKASWASKGRSGGGRAGGGGDTVMGRGLARCHVLLWAPACVPLRHRTLSLQLVI